MKRKRCFKCRSVKSLADFYKHKNMRDGYLNKCKSCLIKESKARKNAGYQYIRPRHGMCGTPEWWSWIGMHARCRRDPLYTSRGISICRRWKIFKHFLEDMGPRPSQQHSLDRVDNDKGYTPDNCRWATSLQQNNNSRRVKRIKFQVKTKSIKEWNDYFGFPRGTVSRRLLAGWSVRRALTESTGT